MAKQQTPHYPGPKRTPPKVRKPAHMVTDHALVRYLERIMGLDVEAIRETILTPAQKQQVRDVRECKLPLGGGHTAVVVNSVVVTIQ